MSTPILSKDISLKRNGKLKDECQYLTNLIERIISESHKEKPSDDSLKQYTKRNFNNTELTRLEFLNPKKTSLLKVYLDLCK